MLITIAAAAMVMAAYFLLLYGGVGFIQDKRFFGSAHKDVLAVIPDKKPERFRGAHIVGGRNSVLFYNFVRVLAPHSLFDCVHHDGGRQKERQVFAAHGGYYGRDHFH